MSDDKKYNGWTNYETWNAALWMGNDEGSDSYWRERAQEVYDAAEADDTFSRVERAALDLADALKDWHEENTPELPPSFYSDVLNAALGEVNWYEIAEHLLDDVDKEETAETASDEDAS